MEKKDFFSSLALVTFGTAAALGGLHFLELFRPHWAVSAMSLALFVAISVGLFFAGESAAKSSSKMAFNNLITASVLGKIVLSMVALLIYFKTVKPADRYFVLPFLLVYVVFTAYETWFMLKLAKMKSGSK